MKYNIAILSFLLFLSCGEEKSESKFEMKETHEKVKLMILAPGHFHAALVQKTMHPHLDSTIYLYAPEGPEVQDFLSKIESYNTREDAPTQWRIEKNVSDDYLSKMIADKPGNVMVVAGKNSKKIDYVLEAVKAGLNVDAYTP